MNLKKTLKIKDMAARNVNGIKGRREKEDKAHLDLIQANSEELADEIQQYICGGEASNKIENLIDMLDTIKLVQENGYESEFNAFLKQNEYDFIEFYPQDYTVRAVMNNSSIKFTLPDSIEGDFGDMEIKIGFNNKSASLYGVGAPWSFQLKSIVEEAMSKNLFDEVIEDVEAFGMALNTLIDDFFKWVNKNFPEEA